jgi:hypothetical protein
MLANSLRKLPKIVIHLMAWGGCGSPFIEMEQSGKVSEIPKCEWIAKRWVGELLLRLGHSLTLSRMFMKHFHVAFKSNFPNSEFQ